jgi:hypothetical protein
MKHTAIIVALLSVALGALVAVTAGAEELTVKDILVAHQAGAPTDGIIAMVNDPANTVAMSAADIVTMRDAGVSESVITAAWNRIPSPAPAPVPRQPDDPRLVDLVSLITSGMSEDIVIEQVRQSELAYNLSVNDLLYLKERGAKEKTIAALMATSTGAPGAPAATLATPPSELIFNDLVLVKKGLFGWFKKDHPGRLVMDGDTLSWEDNRGSEGSFQFQATGIDRVWMTCEARSSGNFCHQINFKIVKGDRYRVQDSHRETGSNAAVLEVMDALRKYQPRLNFSTPNVDD